MKNPQIIIRRSKWIEPMFNAFVDANPKWAGRPMPTERQMRGRINRYKAYWKADGKKILTAIQKVTGLSYNRNIIDVHVVARSTRDMSFPLIIKSRYNHKQFLDVMTEELLHMIFSQNRKKANKIFYKIQAEYPGRSDTFVSHVMVFTAFLKVYKKVKLPFRPRFTTPDYKDSFKVAQLLVK